MLIWYNLLWFVVVNSVILIYPDNRGEVTLFVGLLPSPMEKIMRFCLFIYLFICVCVHNNWKICGQQQRYRIQWIIPAEDKQANGKTDLDEEFRIDRCKLECLLMLSTPFEFGVSGQIFNPLIISYTAWFKLLLLLCAKSHMLSTSRWQPHLFHVSAVDRH